MTRSEKYDKLITGLISGLVLPLVIGFAIYLFTPDHKSLGHYLNRISEAHIITHAITLCVFPNILVFILFNRLDMLRALKGVLAITIVWALIVFGVKFL